MTLRQNIMNIEMLKGHINHFLLQLLGSWYFLVVMQATTITY